MKLLERNLVRPSTLLDWTLDTGRFYMCRAMANKIWPEAINKTHIKFVVRDKPVKERGERKVDLGFFDIRVSGKLEIPRNYSRMHEKMIQDSGACIKYKTVWVQVI